jgi:membrane protein implicated in regulation of membrane protease activity
VNAWVWWLGAAGLLLVGEMLTTTLLLGMVALGAVAAAVVSLLGGSFLWQVVAFAVVSLALLLVARPVARRHLRTPIELRSGVAALVGADAEVLAEVDGRDGRIKISGETWSARSADGTSVFVPGQTVKVVEISGATALVS